MTASAVGHSDFNRWRAFFWPVHAYELKKLIPMLLIFFLLNFDYNVLRTLKDALIVTAEGSGAEVIPFIKVWAMFPGAIALTFLFTRFSNRYSHEKVFYLMLGLFLSYFFFFTFFLYPFRDSLHLHAFADSLQSSLPLGFKGVIAMVRYWTFTLFYAMSELWSSTILAMLFWGFANQVTKLSEAKRFYGLFGIGANFSGVAAGLISVYICRGVYNPSLPFGSDAWEQSMTLLISLVIVTGLLAMALFRWMNAVVLTDRRFCHSSAPSSKEEQGSKEQSKLTLRETFSYLMRTPYLLYIAVIVLSYNVVINLVEVLWKHQVKELYPDKTDYTLYMNQVTALIGFLATLSSLLVPGNCIRKFGWTFTAMLTPVILLLTSVGFFGFFFLKGSSWDLSHLFFSTTPLMLVVFFGSAQNVMSRAAKYSVFDATKEMAFVPLSDECKLKGKAVIDGVCSRLGKSGGAFIHQSLLILFSTLAASAPYVGVFLLLIIGGWTSATYVLGQKFNKLTANEAASAPSLPRTQSESAQPSNQSEGQSDLCVSLLPSGQLQEQKAV